MIKSNANARTIGTSEYKDCRSNIHTVKHSVIVFEDEKQELEEKIVEGLCRIFTNGRKKR